MTATKGREPLLTPEVEAFYHAILPGIVEAFGGHLFTANGDEEHSHMLVGVQPTIAPSDFVRDVKAETSRRIREEFPDIDFRWQRSFAAFSVTPWDMQKLFDYIHNQKTHHAKGTLVETWELSA